MFAAYGPGRSRHRKSESDPGHPYVTPPYTIHWPAPARQPTRSPSRNSSVEREGDPFVARPGSLLAKQAVTPPRARSPSPGSIGQRPLIKHVGPQPPRTAFNVTASPQQKQLQQYSLSGMSHLHHHRSSSSHHHHLPPTTTHHVSHPPRSHSRPPVLRSHRYASSITPTSYGHGGSNTSRTSLTGGVPSLNDYNASSPPAGMSSLSYYYVGTAQVASGSPQRSHSYTRTPSPSPARTMPTHPSHIAHKPEEPQRQQRAAKELHRNARRPALPPNYDGLQETRYVAMLLAIDDISTLYNILAAMSAWIMLAGFVLAPSTFASWQSQPAGTPQGIIARLISGDVLLIIASTCTAMGVIGMLSLWWRWRANYVWITQYLFIPGFLNSFAGLISTLSSVYGTQHGVFGVTGRSALIVTGSLTIIWGTLMMVYEYCLIRKLRLEHDEEVGVELAGKHGEGILVTDENNGKAGKA